MDDPLPYQVARGVPAASAEAEMANFMQFQRQIG